MSGVPKGNIHLKTAFDRLLELYEADNPLPPEPKIISRKMEDGSVVTEGEEEQGAWRAEGDLIWNKCTGHFLGALISGELVAYYLNDHGDHLKILPEWWEIGVFPGGHFLGNTISIDMDSIRDREYQNYDGQTPFVDEQDFEAWLSRSSPGVKSLSSAKESFEDWFKNLVGAQPNLRPRKADILKEAQEQIAGLSERSFKTVWKGHAPESWTKPGRKKS